MEKLVVTPEIAAKALSIRTDDLRKLLESGDIPAYRDGRNWKIPVELLKQYPVIRAKRETEARKNEGAFARNRNVVSAD